MYFLSSRGNNWTRTMDTS